MSYPITTNLRERLGADALMDPMGEYALDFIGEYEHGSVDVESLYPANLQSFVAVAEMTTEEREQMQTEMLTFAANVLHDYLLTVSVQEGEQAHTPDNTLSDPELRARRIERLSE